MVTVAIVLRHDQITSVSIETCILKWAISWMTLKMQFNKICIYLFLALCFHMYDIVSGKQKWTKNYKLMNWDEVKDVKHLFTIVILIRRVKNLLRSHTSKNKQGNKNISKELFSTDTLFLLCLLSNSTRKHSPISLSLYTYNITIAEVKKRWD